MSTSLLLFLLSCALPPSTSSDNVSSTGPPSPSPEVILGPLCSRVPHSFDPFNKDLVQHSYNATKEELFLDLTDLLHKFCDDGVYNTSVAGAFRCNQDIFMY